MLKIKKYYLKKKINTSEKPRDNYKIIMKNANLLYEKLLFPNLINH